MTCSRTEKTTSMQKHVKRTRRKWTMRAQKLYDVTFSKAIGVCLRKCAKMMEKYVQKLEAMKLHEW